MPSSGILVTRIPLTTSYIMRYSPIAGKFTYVIIHYYVYYNNIRVSDDSDTNSNRSTNTAAVTKCITFIRVYTHIYIYIIMHSIYVYLYIIHTPEMFRRLYIVPLTTCLLNFRFVFRVNRLYTGAARWSPPHPVR